MCILFPCSCNPSNSHTWVPSSSSWPRVTGSDFRLIWKVNWSCHWSAQMPKIGAKSSKVEYSVPQIWAFVTDWWGSDGNKNFGYPNVLLGHGPRQGPSQNQWGDEHLPQQARESGATPLRVHRLSPLVRERGPPPPGEKWSSQRDMVWIQSLQPAVLSRFPQDQQPSVHSYKYSYIHIQIYHMRWNKMRAAPNVGSEL